jgi:hypothetical protein
MNQLNGPDDRYSVEIDDCGNYRSFAARGAKVRVPLDSTHYEVNGASVRLTRIGAGPTFELTDAQTGTKLPVELALDADDEMRIRPIPVSATVGGGEGGAARVSLTPDDGFSGGIRLGDGEQLTSWSITFALPLDAEFHLPGVPINTEFFTEFEGLGYWGFSQNATQSLIAKRAGPQEQRSLQVKCGLPDFFAWLDKPSPDVRLRT